MNRKLDTSQRLECRSRGHINRTYDYYLQRRKATRILEYLDGSRDLDITLFTGSTGQATSLCFVLCPQWCWQTVRFLLWSHVFQWTRKAILQNIGVSSVVQHKGAVYVISRVCLEHSFAKADIELHGTRVAK